MPTQLTPNTRRNLKKFGIVTLCQVLAFGSLVLLAYTGDCTCSRAPVNAASSCPPAPSCTASVVVQLIDREEAFYAKYQDNVNGKSLTPEGYCMRARPKEIALEWCKLQAEYYDCAYDSWMDAWPAHKPNTEGPHPAIYACCGDDPESQADCRYMKERAKVCDELLGQTHKPRCAVTACGQTSTRTVCL